MSIDDLFAALPEKARLDGPGPFVINLSVSTAPIDLPTRTFDGCQNVHVYQVLRTEDRRPRYRLRLGPFADEDTADAMLEKVRDTYPGALTATAEADDLRAIGSIQAKTQSVKSSAPAPNAVPSVESTQTVRALTVPELEDEQSLRWFVIQLSMSEEPFDSEMVPNLDIFSVYRLYSVAGIDQGRILHALRLGFFSEEVAAAAVASYLEAFYEKPAVKRVSAAERERFADQRFEPRKDVGATGKHAVIEITNERYVREKRGSAFQQK